jgi:hypothetical protein
MRMPETRSRVAQEEGLINMPVKVESENKKVFTTPHATVVMVNGKITFMKVCRPAYKDASRKEHEERDITFESFTEFWNLAIECMEVAEAVRREL